jgi:hypothetical protein
LGQKCLPSGVNASRAVRASRRSMAALIRIEKAKTVREKDQSVG